MVEIEDIDCQGATMRLRSTEAEARGGGKSGVRRG
jgi:hypothetical protein